MKADLEIGLQPFGELIDELLAEIGPMPWPGLLEAMV
jgi:hypothetical protein